MAKRNGSSAGLAVRKRPTRTALFKSKRFWKPAPASYYEQTGVSPYTKLSIPRYVEQPNKSTIAVPTKNVEALTKARGSKRQGFIEKLKENASSATQRLAPVSEQVKRADKIEHLLTVVQPGGVVVTTKFRGRAARDKIAERNHAVNRHYRKHDDAALERWKAKYAGNFTVTDIHGRTYALIVDPAELDASYARMTKKQRQRLQEPYAVEAD
jgi:hypothetical protein